MRGMVLSVVFITAAIGILLVISGHPIAFIVVLAVGVLLVISVLFSQQITGPTYIRNASLSGKPRDPNFHLDSDGEHDEPPELSSPTRLDDLLRNDNDTHS